LFVLDDLIRKSLDHRGLNLTQIRDDLLSQNGFRQMCPIGAPGLFGLFGALPRFCCLFLFLTLFGAILCKFLLQDPKTARYDTYPDLGAPEDVSEASLGNLLKALIDQK
jgi:hypothetical protein